MSSLRAETMAGGAHRLYVFGVTFSALFLLGFLLTAIVAADLRRSGGAARPAAMTDPAESIRQSAFAAGRAARGEVSRAREKLNAAEVALFQFLNGQVVDSARQPPAPPVAVSQNQTPQTATQPDPQLAELERDLAAAKQQKTSMLERLTPSHPTIQNLESSIADLEKRIDAAHKANPIEPPRSELQLPVAMQSDAGGLQAEAATLDKLRNLTIRAGRAQRDYEVALENERIWWGEYSRLATAVSIPPSPRSAQESPGARPMLAIGVLLLFTLICGIVAAAGARRPESTFASVAEVESELRLPVLGSVKLANGTESSVAMGSWAEPSWVRRSVALGELMLAIAIVSMAVMTMVNFSLARQILADPLSGIAEGIAKLRDLACN